jgi:late competence protein required for DNA uptake (superfamily II DNA/RNA helicase)
MGEDTFEQLYRRIENNNVYIDKNRYLKNWDDDLIIMNIAPQLIEYKKKQDKNNKKIDLEK